MFIKRSGCGRALVLLSGWAMNRHCWDVLLPELQRHYQTMRFDLPGHQDGCGSRFSFSVPRQLLQALAEQIPDHSIWVGWSLGGLLAQQLAHYYPSKVRHLVCIASSPCFLKKKDWSYGMPLTVFDDFVRAFEADHATALERFLTLQAAKGTKPTQRMKQLICSKYQADELKAALQILRWDLRKALSQFNFPVLFIGGNEDQLMNTENLKASARLAHRADYLEINGAGHLPMVSHPQQLCQIILKYLNE